MIRLLDVNCKREIGVSIRISEKQNVFISKDSSCAATEVGNEISARSLWSEAATLESGVSVRFFVF